MIADNWADAEENIDIAGDEIMKNKKWKAFDKLTEKCYLNMIGANKDNGCWEEAFGLLKEIILEERQKIPGFGSDLETLEDDTDYEHDIQGWLEDCLDEIEMREENKLLLDMCNDLFELFDWPEYTGSDIKFRKAYALADLGRADEASEYCREWMSSEPENIAAATAGVLAFTDAKQYEEAEKLVNRFIPAGTECFDENEIMFSAASKLYGAMGRKEEKKRIEKALEAYDEYLEEYFENADYDGADFITDDELPFS